MASAGSESSPQGTPDRSELLRGFTKAIQIGAVVRDIEKTMQALTDLFGIGPFRVVDCPPPGNEDRQLLRGGPVWYRTRQAFADLRSVELELIQLLEGESVWSEFLASRGEGLHHIRFNCENLDEVLDYLGGKGIAGTQEGPGIREGTRWANLDTEKRVGFILELMKPLPGTDGRTPGVTAEHDRPKEDAG